MPRSRCVRGAREEPLRNASANERETRHLRGEIVEVISARTVQIILGIIPVGVTSLTISPIGREVPGVLMQEGTDRTGAGNVVVT